ncbi:MAG: CobW family GTP-binding protein [Eubacteriales bacterium]
MTKVDIFSGFLGAGKTTLIQKLIREAYRGEKLVLIENEFGEIGVDGTFLSDAGVQITEMNSGCICCSLVGDFGRALQKVLDDYAPERILIEPSGVGKLSDVIRAVQNVDSEDMVLNSFTTVVDAKKCRMYMKNFGEFFNNQVENASSIILSHTAGMSEAKLAECVALLRARNADATIVTTDWNEITGGQILDAMEKKSTLEAELERLKEEARHDDEDEHEHHHHHDDDEDEHEHEHEHHHHHDDDDDDDEDEHEHHHHHDDDEDEHEHHHHDGECCHDGHHHHHADEVFTSWGRETARVYTAEEMQKILASLENESEYGIVLRAKGFVCAPDGWLYFDYVPGTPDVRRGSPAVTGRICVIGSQLHEDRLEELFGLR